VTDLRGNGVLARISGTEAAMAAAGKRKATADLGELETVLHRP
jgi:hypothetical protein